MQRVHEPQSRSSGALLSISAVVTTVPRTTHDPCDEQGVLPVEPHPCAGSTLPVDVLVLVHEHTEGATEALAELLQLLAKLRVAVVPRVPRQASLVWLRLRPGRVVGERGGDDRAGAGHKRLGMAAHLGLRHGEAHAREEAASAALADVALGLVVGLCGRRPHGVETELRGQATELRLLHMSRKVAALGR